MPANLENTAVATGLEKGQFSFQSQRKAMLKNPHAILETLGRFLVWKDTLEEGMATHSSILA